MSVGDYAFGEGCRTIASGFMAVASSIDRYTLMQEKKAATGKEAVDRLSTAIEEAVVLLKEESK
jgi:hypothetical protein